MMVDQPAPLQTNTVGDGEEDEGGVPSGPVTAPGGWSSLLTWRKPKGKPQRQATAPPPSSPPSSSLQTQMPSQQYSPPSAHHRASSRSRAPIPFDIGPRRTPSSSSTISDDLSLSPPQSDIIDGSDAVGGLSSAFATLARVREKDDTAQGTVKRGRPPSSSSTPRLSFVTPPSTPDSVPPGGWLAWTSRIRSTLPRGVASTLFYPDLAKEGVPKDEVGNDSLSSPTTSTSNPSTVSSEKWRAGKGDEIDRLVDRMVGFAGVDEESRSIVTLSVPGLPPSSQVSHDAILQRILTRTLPLVENPGGYTLILFASGADLIDGSDDSKAAWPGWAWCWKAWRSLGRSYRKNLKKLYIIHPTRFTRTLVRLISTGSYFISPKFARKIVQLDSLEALNRLVPLSQLDIPPEVLIWDLKMGAKEDVNPASEEAQGSGNGSIPAVVRDCVEALKGNSNIGQRCLLEVEGIFRVSPSNALLRSAKYAYRLNRRPNFAPFVEKDDHLPAALLKDFFRCLRVPIFPSSVYGLIESCPSSAEGNDTLEYVRQVLFPTLAEDRLILLNYVLQCLHEVSLRSDKNRMDASNLAVVMTPNLVHGEDAVRDVKMCRVHKMGEGNQLDGVASTTTTLGMVIAFCIDRYYEVFDEVDYELPILNFHSPDRANLGTLTRSKKVGLAVASRHHPPGSPPRHASSTPNGGVPSPSTRTPTTLRSSNSIRGGKSRLLSGGSFRAPAGVGGAGGNGGGGGGGGGGGSGGAGLAVLNSSTLEKGIQSVALVGTSATGEFERGPGAGAASSRRPSVGRTSSSSEWERETEADASALSAPYSPSPQVKRTASNAELSVPRHDRRPLSEVFEE